MKKAEYWVLVDTLRSDRLWDNKKRTIVTSRNVIFKESLTIPKFKTTENTVLDNPSEEIDLMKDFLMFKKK